MKKYLPSSVFVIVCCTILFRAGSAFGQGYDTCAHLRVWQGKSSYYTDTAFYHQQYDTLRYYIDKCAGTDKAAYTAFSYLDNAAQLMSRDTTRYDKYRAWLISVLYLNTPNPKWFCVVMGSISGTFVYGKYAPLGYFAVMNYIRQSGRCGWDSLSQAEYSLDSAYDANHGSDPSQLPPLDSLGLGFLLNGVTSSNSVSSSSLASFTSSPNPFIKETTLEFTLNRMSYVTLAIYDELGRVVWGDGRGSSLEAGTHDIQIDSIKLPSGMLYARIATGFGEVKTVKLVHEK